MGKTHMTDKSGKRNCKSGEMLIETIISIAVFALVIVTVSSLIAAAYRMLGQAQSEDTRIAEACGRIELLSDEELAEGDLAGLEYSFKLTETSPEGASATQNVTVHREDEIVFFAPENP
ncbi:hypothetical protein LJC56_00795 [Christensenellaceae bacterium OttesenSCG-928-K19]|nr:hypothetical protein [Christensenellaceae bacterium OttesenSCG-928-K19]